MQAQGNNADRDLSHMSGDGEVGPQFLKAIEALSTAFRTVDATETAKKINEGA